jgi:hypothetical protein
MADEKLQVTEQLAAIRQELVGLGQRLGALFEQQKELAALVAQALPRRSEGKSAEQVEHPSGALVREILVKCGQDIQRVLREVGRPLTTLEILDELVQRHLSWRESTVSHTLADLMDRGVIHGSRDSGPRRHRLIQPPGQPGARTP